MSTYTKAEVDSMISNLITRINTATGTLNTTKNAISSHNTALDAHNVIISTKAAASTVTDLSTTVGELTERITNLELANKPVLDGTLNYSVSGKAGETDVSIAFDIEPIDENNPVTYEVYGDDSRLLAGLTFDAAAGTISGQPTVGGSASYTVLAKSGSYGVFITILQSFHASFDGLLDVLRSSDVSSLSGQLGVPITIKMADDTEDSSRTLTYNSATYTRAAGSDITDSDGEVTLFAWSSGSSTIYTSEVAIFGSDVVGTGESIKNSSGGVIGTLETTPSYMKDYRIMMTSYDTDTISDSNKPSGYVHNARMEFLDVVCGRAYDSDGDSAYEPSDIRAYLTSTAADGFLRRLPIDIRNIIVPADIECATKYGQIATLTDKVFLPSAFELCGISDDSYYWYQEGIKSLYYPASYDFYVADDTRIRYYNGKARGWCTRTVGHLSQPNQDMIVTVSDDGSVNGVVGAGAYELIVPAFVIA